MQFPHLSEEVIFSKNQFNELKSQNTRALNELKKLNFDYADGLISKEEFLNLQPIKVNTYRPANKTKNQKYKEHQKLLSEKKFLGFDNFQMFLGEFGWALGLLLYSFFNLFRSFSNNRVSGELIIHSTLLYIGLFYSCYPFIFPFTSDADYPRTTYTISLVLCSVFLIYGSYKIAVNHSQNVYFCL